MPIMRHPPRKAGFRSGRHGSSRVYRLWFVVCVLSSAWAQENPASRTHFMVLCSTSWQALKFH
eukprot:6405027-Amphidinium_carterae.1